MSRQRLRLMVAAGLLTTAFVMQGNRAHAQTGNVGIGTSSPDASAKLDISATDKGVLFPRVALTASNAAGPVTSPATGLMVYNTATTTTGTNDVSPGIYIWTGSAWAKVNTSTATGNDKNIYEGDGTLTSARTVSQGANPLTFTGTGGVKVTSTSTSGYPLQLTHPLTTGLNQPGLQIGGASGTAATGQAAFIGFNPNNSQGAWPIVVGAQYVNGSAGQGAADFVVATSNGGNAATKFVVQNGGNVGVGTTAPAEKFQVGDAAGTGNVAMAVTNSFGVGRIGMASTSAAYGATQPGDLIVNNNTTGKGIGLVVASGSSGVTPNLYVASTGNVGIGTATPGSTLQVNGSFAGNYNTQTGNYTLAANDFYVVYNGSATGTFTLPASATTTKGRLYSIKNTTAAQTLNINAGSGENIDGAATIAVSPGNSVQLVNTGGAAGSGTTWEVVNFAATTTSTGTTLYTGNGTLSGPRIVTTGANTLSFVNGSKSAVIDLTTSGTDALLQLKSASTANWARLGTNGSPFAVVTTGTDVSNSTPSIFASNAGNVGIGNTNPTSDANFTAATTTGHLDVSGAINSRGGLITLQGANPTPGNNPIAAIYNQANVGTTMTGLNIDFQTSASGSAPTSKMRLLSNGNVGIGTTTPNSTLQVNGSISEAVTVNTATSGTVNLDGTMHTLVFTGNGNLSAVLPAASGVLGREYVIINSGTGGSANNVAVTVSGGGTINTIVPGNTFTTYYMRQGGTSSRFIATSNGWLLMNNPVQTPFYFGGGATAGTYDISPALSFAAGVAYHFTGVWYSACNGINEPIEFTVSSGRFIKNGANASAGGPAVSLNTGDTYTYTLSANGKVLTIATSCTSSEVWTINAAGTSMSVTSVGGYTTSGLITVE